MGKIIQFRPSATVGLLVLMLFAAPVFADASPTPDGGAGAIAQSYETSTSNIAPGTILSLQKTGGKVSPAHSSDTSDALIGIATTEPLLQLSSTSQASVQVALSGTAGALVSNLNGDIVTGDKITSSPIDGVGMKAVQAGEIVGTAQATLSSVLTTTRLVTDRSGKQVIAKIGLIPISVNVEFYSAAANGSLSSFVPSFLQNVADAIAGKPVSPLRVIISILLLIIGTITVIVMLSSGIRNGIISLGRNPLAEKVLLKGLVDIILAALGVLLITFVAVYAVITA